ncbi:OmpA family protein [Chitinophaga niabensis]|uniref:OmpA family protein n=1 Tax=Chitinophaga niabensis TaxID=536979 RepID=UPI0031BB0D0B
MKQYYFLFLAWLVLFSQQLSAQEQKSELRLAEEAYARQEYALAGSLFNRIAKNKGSRTPTDLMMKLAVCHRETGNFYQAAGWYAEVIRRPDHASGAYFAYGEVLRNMEQYDSARKQYNLFESAQPDSLVFKAVALQGCDSAVLWQSHKVNTDHLKGLKELNTPYSEWISGMMQQGLLITGNGYRKMIQGDGGGANPASDKRTFQPYYKAYVYQQYQGTNSNMYLEDMLPKILGKYDYHIGPACFNKTEDTLYVTVNEQERPEIIQKRGPLNGRRLLTLYRSVKKDNKWTPLEILAGLNMDGFSSSHPVLNSAGDLLYFVSDRPGGYGQTDIWYSEKLADSNWGKPVNCGPRINTVAAETFPSFNAEGTLYFSSKGHPGMGGYDIFRVTGNKAEWTMPFNLQPPFNSGADDMSFILGLNGYEGYFASNRAGGAGSDDVYHFMDPAYSGWFTNGIRGTAVDKNVAAGNPSATGNNTAATIPSKVTHTADELEIKRNIEKHKFLYDFNSAELLSESRKILDEVAGTLQQHPDWKLMVHSFTDSRGTDQYNVDLSALRCYAVIDYLVKKGISPKRLFYKNMGEQHLINPCSEAAPCTEEQQRENRRSELRVIW